MRFDVMTLFPNVISTYFNESIIGRALKKELLYIHCHNIREYADNKHNRVDDTPYGGGMGMVMQAEPIYNCYNHIKELTGDKPYTIYMSPKGTVLTQKKSIELSKMENIVILCGHYEGVDQRILDLIVDEEISIGDYVLTGGEIPAMALVDSIVRLLPDVLAGNECFELESHYNGLLEHPQYTKPRIFEGMEVPEVLLSGNHKLIDEWRYNNSLEITKNQRFDLYNEYKKKNNTK